MDRPNRKQKKTDLRHSPGEKNVKTILGMILDSTKFCTGTSKYQVNNVKYTPQNSSAGVTSVLPLVERRTFCRADSCYHHIMPSKTRIASRGDHCSSSTPVNARIDTQKFLAH